MSHYPPSNSDSTDSDSTDSDSTDSESSGIDGASSNASANARRWKPSKPFRAVTLIVLAIILVPYVLLRTTSGWRQLVVSGETAKVVSGDDALGTETPHRPLRIVAWNIAHGRGSGDSNLTEGGEPKRARVKQIAAFIKKLNADVVVLNEVDFSATWSGGFDQAEAIACEAGYPVCVKQSNLDFGFLYGRWYFGNVILSRLPIADPQVVDLKPLAQWESWLVGHKRGLSCTVELPTGQKVSVVGLHLESRNETIRSAQVDDVARHCGTLAHPIIAAGDLNTTPGSFPGAQKASDGSNAFDKLINQTQFTRDSRDPEKSESLTYSTEEPKLAIDWVLVSHELALKKVEIIESMLSDHRPAVATIEFK